MTLKLVFPNHVFFLNIDGFIPINQDNVLPNCLKIQSVRTSIESELKDIKTTWS